MKVAIIKGFAYAHDGVTSEWLSAGAEHDIRDELVPGLTAAGYVRQPGDQKSPSEQKPPGDQRSPGAPAPRDPRKR